jgi:SAM-dependent methyltransferase
MQSDAANRWRCETIARARAWWTDERFRNLLGGKRLIIDPVQAAPLLRVIGLLNSDGSMPAPAVRKFMQVSHMVTLLEPMMMDLAHELPRVDVVDLGCGSSYLSFLLAWCFEHRWRHPARVAGVDRNQELILTCQRRAVQAGLEQTLRFEAARLEALPPDTVSGVHVLVALHACDTATDEALALAIRQRARVIAVAPCCQAELSRLWARVDANAEMYPIFGSPHLRRELAATVTDSYRMLLLRACGYSVTAMEFVPSPHTPKNTLLRAVYSGLPDAGAAQQYRALRSRFGGFGIRLEQLLPDPVCQTLLGP